MAGSGFRIFGQRLAAARKIAPAIVIPAAGGAGGDHFNFESAFLAGVDVALFHIVAVWHGQAPLSGWRMEELSSLSLIRSSRINPLSYDIPLWGGHCGTGKDQSPRCETVAGGWRCTRKSSLVRTVFALRPAASGFRSVYSTPASRRIRAASSRISVRSLFISLQPYHKE